MSLQVSNIAHCFRITFSDGRDLLALSGKKKDRESTTLLYVNQMHDSTQHRIVPGRASAVLFEHLDAKGAPLLLTYRSCPSPICFVVSVTSGEVVAQSPGEMKTHTNFSSVRHSWLLCDR